MAVQARFRHRNDWPTGIATQTKWLQNGINVPLKSERLVRYFKTFKKELIEIIYATCYEHSCQFEMNDIEMNVDDHNLVKDFSQTFRNKKTPVTFKSFQHLKNCEYLGSRNKSKS